MELNKFWAKVSWKDVTHLQRNVFLAQKKLKEWNHPICQNVPSFDVIIIIYLGRIEFSLTFLITLFLDFENRISLLLDLEEDFES